MDLFSKDVFKSVFQFVVSPKSIWLAGSVSGVVVFLPEKWLKVLGLAGIASEYKAAAGMIFVVSCVKAAELVFRFFVKKGCEVADRRRINSALKALTYEQSELLRTLTKERAFCGFLPCDKECVQQMMDAGILIAVGAPFLFTVGRVERLRKYALHPLARQYFYGKLNG